MPTSEFVEAALHHHKAGRIEQAEAFYRQALASNPLDADALYLFGLLMHGAGDTESAVELVGRSVQLKDSPEFLNNLGFMLHSLHRSDEALGSFDRALKLRPQFAEPHAGRGAVHLERHDFETALEECDRALAIDPRCLSALINRGESLRLLRRLDEAEQSFVQAIAVDPDAPAAYGNYGRLLLILDRQEEALKHLLRAAKLGARHGAEGLDEIYRDVANILYVRDQLEMAMRFAGRALELNPQNASAWFTQGQVLESMGQNGAAIEMFNRAIAIKPKYAEARWARAMAHLPAILPTEAERPTVRAAFADQLLTLEQWFDADRPEDGWQAVACAKPFYLSYQAENNRVLMGTYGQLCSRVMADWMRSRHLKVVAGRSEQRVRLVIVSAYVYDHSVWWAILKGWISHLYQTRVEVHLVSIGRTDAQARWAEAHVSSFEQLGKDLEQAVNVISSKAPDLLLYSDIGMEPIIQQLASLRLCPKQLVTWGHPMTTGLPTIDYFISADDFEPPDAQAHYSESLFRLPGMGCSYEPLQVAVANGGSALLGGLKPGVPVLIAPGTPFKYAPENDHVFIDIARRVGACQIVFFSSQPEHLSQLLKARLESAFAAEGLSFSDTCRFSPWLNRAEFYQLLRQSDVCLDTIGFSGFNTAMQAVECGLPIVTRAGQFMRGRFAAGILRRMGLQELVVETNAAYVDVAVRLVTDAEYRRTCRLTIESRRQELFGDPAPVRALEAFLCGLVAN